MKIWTTGVKAAAAAGLLALSAYVLWPQQRAALAVAAPAPGWESSGVASPFAAGACAAAATACASNTAQAAVFTPATALALSQTSLAGTQSDGDWSVDSQGQLRASQALRQRFDYFLSLIGEMSVADMRALVEREALASLKPASVAQVMGMWDRYVKLQQHAWKTQVDLRQPSSWSVALAERQSMRRDLLGADWADAFYGQEERQLQQQIAKMNTNAHLGSSVTDEAIPAPVQHPEATQREAQHQANWQAWEQRLQAARQHISQLKAAPELSAPQREQAIAAYISTQFQGTELVRARGLLGAY